MALTLLSIMDLIFVHDLHEETINMQDQMLTKVTRFLQRNEVCDDSQEVKLVSLV